MLTDQDRNIIQDAISILQYYYDATLAFSETKFVTLSYVYPIFNTLLVNTTLSNNDEGFTIVLKKNFKLLY